MTYCYSLMDSPGFLLGDGGCDAVKHDISVVAGGLGSFVESAILIQLNTDARADNQRGWWGDEFQPFPIGNRLWTLSGGKNVAGIAAKSDEYVRAALGPLMSDNETLNVSAVRTIEGVEVAVDIEKSGNRVFNQVI